MIGVRDFEGYIEFVSGKTIVADKNLSDTEKLNKELQLRDKDEKPAL